MSKATNKKNKQQVITNESVQRKEYSYSIGQINLRFTLRTDNSSELRQFRQLMEAALEQIDNDIQLIKN